MIQNYIIDLNTYELEDLMVHYLMFKKYPINIKKEVIKLQRKILKQIKKWENNNPKDIDEIKYYIVEKTKSNKENKIEVEIDCLMLRDLLSEYLEYRTKSLPESIWKKIDELQEEVEKYLPHEDEYLEEDSEIHFEQEIKYIEP